MPLSSWATFENLPGILYVYDRHGRFRKWNNQFERVSGYSADEIRQMITLDFIEAKDRDLVTSRIADVFARGHASVEANFLSKNGTATPFLLTGDRLEIDGETCVFGMGIDISERVKLQAQFLRVQRLESIGTLAGGIAHDLNNILSPILMAVGLLKTDEPSAQRMALLDTIEVSGRRGSDMVRQILAFARGTEGRRVEVNVRHLFREAQKILRETIPKNIDVRFTVPPDLWTVDADVTQLNQVLMNLCVNARDAMPDGGRLAVAAENLMLDEMFTGMLGELPAGPYVVITAVDTGTGMSRETQERIFEPFFTTKEPGKGTGLGLSTVVTIVKAHGGAIDLHSQVGAGTTFRIFLPAFSGAPTATPEAEVPLPHGHGELILVVDDEENVRALTQKTLEQYGYRVLVADHGANAVALYAQHRDVAVVLTDMVMPVMDGVATITALKAINPQVLVIASSGHSTADAHEKAVATGVTGFLDKPYTVETLVRAIHFVLSSSSKSEA